MATTTDYLNQLQIDKTNLVNNLITKGVEASTSETFTSLVPKVLNIPSGGSMKFKQGSFTLTENVSQYAITGLGFTPKLIIVNGNTLGQATTIRTAYWLRNDFLGESMTYSYRNASSITTTIAYGTRYCVSNSDGFTVMQYLTYPIIPGDYTWIAFSDE